MTAVRARRVALLCELGDVALSEVEMYGYRKCLVQNIQEFLLRWIINVAGLVVES